MAAKNEKSGQSAGPVSPASSAEFAEFLERRRRAAGGLERDLLTQVPLLYGSPGSLEPDGDPGIVLARAHQDEMLRRNGGGVFNAGGRRTDATLPFERATTALAIGLFLLLLFMK